MHKNKALVIKADIKIMIILNIYFWLVFFLQRLIEYPIIFPAF